MKELQILQSLLLIQVLQKLQILQQEMQILQQELQILQSKTQILQPKTQILLPKTQILQQVMVQFLPLELYVIRLQASPIKTNVYQNHV